MDTYKTNVLTWGLFLAPSIKAATHLGPDFLTNSEVYKNTKFENIWSVFNITRKLIKEHSEEILNVECLEYSSPSWTTSELANDQSIKWAKAEVCVYADSVVCWTQMKDTPGATERWKGQVEDLKSIRRTKTQWDSTENRLNSSGKCSQDVRHYLFFARSRTTWRHKNIIMPEDFKDRIIFMSMFNDIEWKKNDEKCISNAKKSGITP